MPDKDENKFLKYTDKYDARTRTRKVTNRNKVMRKVKKIKENKKSFGTSTFEEIKSNSEAPPRISTS